MPKSVPNRQPWLLFETLGEEAAALHVGRDGAAGVSVAPGYCCSTELELKQSNVQSQHSQDAITPALCSALSLYFFYFIAGYARHSLKQRDGGLLLQLV